MPNFDLIGDYSAKLVAHRFDFGDGEPSISQIRQGALQGVMQIVLEGRSLFGRSKDARVYAVDLAVAGIRKDHQLDLLGCRGHSYLRLIMEPGSRGEQNKNQDYDYREVVLPGSALVGPKKGPRQDLPQTGHSVRRNTVDNHAITHVHHAIEVSHRFGVMRDHYDGLPKIFVELPQHLQHDF